jgi:hypothetical protein
MAAEEALGHDPRDVSADCLGYDIESRPRDSGHLRFLEVKGRAEGATTVTLTKNEILTALNKPESWILALVRVPPEATSPKECAVRYVRSPFQREPDFGVTSVNYDLDDLLARAEEPA